eukprot:8271638-Alexandrium_andersonii.AAC.1
MSASLVGSEMCIRDSARSAAARWRVSRASRTSRRAGTRRHAGPRPSSPVSYTHLTLPTICSV